MDDPKQRWISGLTEEFPLTGIDQNAPKVYSRVVYGFPFKGEANFFNEAVDYLRKSFFCALVCYPFMGGQVVHPPDSKLLRLVYSNDQGQSGFLRFHGEVFGVQKLHRNHYPWDFEGLQQANAPPNAFNKDVFSLSPAHLTSLSGSYSYYHPVTLRVTFIEGGILLCFACHHSVADGAAFTAFLDCMFNNQENHDIEALQQAHAADLQRRTGLIMMFRGTQPVDVSLLPEYDFNFSAPSIPLPLPSPTRCAAKVIILSAARISELKSRACAYLQSVLGDSAFVSGADTVCGLVWLHVTRARLHHLDPNQPTRFATAIDIRNRMRTILGEKPYIGNMFLRTMTDKNVTVKDLVNADDTSSPAKIRDIAEAAWLIRRAIQAFDDPNHIRRHLILLSNVLYGPSPDDISKASDLALQKANAGLDNSVWAGIGADIEFKIPGTHGGKPNWARKTYSANDGCMNIMPRKGGTQGTENWEVLLTLRDVDMKKLYQRQELGGYMLGAPPAKPPARIL